MSLGVELPLGLERVARVTYFKRYRMEIDLAALPIPDVTAGIRLLPWNWGLLEAHAEVLHASFRHEIDARVFPSLSERGSCAMLMTAVARKRGFLADATWLAVGAEGPCATVQGICERGGVGAIQNLGVVPARRGQGLGRAILLRALHGFRLAGLSRGLLEVTAENECAIRLYRELGFRRCKTLYKAVTE
jgi:ribosomal protein S18 acetylase RimI-like enzyme